MLETGRQVLNDFLLEAVGTTPLPHPSKLTLASYRGDAENIEEEGDQEG